MNLPKTSQEISAGVQLEQFKYHPDQRVELYCHAIELGLSPHQAADVSNTTRATVRSWNKTARALKANKIKGWTTDWRTTAVQAIKKATVHATAEMIAHIRQAAPDDWRAAASIIKYYNDTQIASARVLAYNAARDRDKAAALHTKAQTALLNAKLKQLSLLCEKLGLELENAKEGTTLSAFQSLKDAINLITEANPILSRDEKDKTIEAIDNTVWNSTRKDNLEKSQQ